MYLNSELQHNPLVFWICLYSGYSTFWQKRPAPIKFDVHPITYRKIQKYLLSLYFKKKFLKKFSESIFWNMKFIF